jgi:hypothetical protein
MNIYYIGLDLFNWLIPHANFLIQKCKTKHLIYIYFNMRMKDKTYGILNFLLLSSLRLKMFSHKLLVTKKFIPCFYLHFNFFQSYN